MIDLIKRTATEFWLGFSKSVRPLHLSAAFLDGRDESLSHINQSLVRTRHRFEVRFVSDGAECAVRTVARSRKEALSHAAHRMVHGVQGLFPIAASNTELEGREREAYAWLERHAKVGVINWEGSAATQKPEFTLTEEDLHRVAGMVTKLVASQFFPSNWKPYSKLGFSEEDIAQYLYETVVMKKYVPNRLKNPSYYTSIAAFRKSLYIACRNACMAHYRTHVKSQRRGDITRAGLVSLNHGKDDNNRDVNIDLVAPTPSDFSALQQQIIDSCHDELIQRMLCFLMYERVDNKSTLRQLMRLPKQLFDDCWARMTEHVGQYAEELRSNSRTTDHVASAWMAMERSVEA